MAASQLLSKLLDYVLEQDKAIDPRGFRLSAHKGFQKCRRDLQGLPGVDFDIKLEGDHVWLRVARLQASPAPPVDARWKGVLVHAEEPDGPAPHLAEAALSHRIVSEQRDAPSAEHALIATRIRAAAQKVLDGYAPLWAAWAAGETPRRRTIGLYGDLFALKHQLESDATSQPHELVWGLGVAAWQLALPDKANSHTDFQYPLITQALELSLDGTTLALELRPRSIEPRIEFDAFAACSLPSAAETERAARAGLLRTPDRLVTPFDVASFEPVLKLIAGSLSDKGRYLPGREGFPGADDELVVSDAWVLLARPRPNNYLHEDIERLKKCIAEGCRIPGGPGAFVTPPSTEKLSFEAVSYRGRSGLVEVAGAKGEPRELFFPLPYNQEQVTIVEQLERSDGVAVQGPPGTGKTHTIANIICHFLATGRKVLVTSKGEQALEVLQEKIPAAVRPLTVALLAGDREGLRQFQSSIEAIIHNVSQLNPALAREEMARIRSAIERAHEELARIDRRVDAIAQTQLSDVTVDGVTLRAQKMAELVVAGEAQYKWFDDVLTLDGQHAPPLTGEQSARLREARRRLGADLVYVAARVPSSQSLLSTAEVLLLHQTLAEMRSIEQRESSGRLLALRAQTPEVLQAARQMLPLVDQALQLAQDLEQAAPAEQRWAAQLRHKCSLAQFDSERAALEALFDELTSLIDARAAFLKRPVEMPTAALTDKKVLDALERAQALGKPFGWTSFGGSETKALVAAIKVSGLEPRLDSDWAHARRWVALHAQVVSFSVRWNQFADTLSVPVIEAGPHVLRRLELTAALVLKAHTLATRYDARLPRLAQGVFAQAPRCAQAGAAELAELRQHLLEHLSRADLALAAASLATLQEKLAGTSGAVSQQLREFVETELGNPEVAAERAVARYAELIADIRRIESLSADIALVQDAAAAVERAGAARFGQRLRTQPLAPTGDDAALPVDWREAWNWSRIRTHLDSIEAREELVNLAARRRDLESGLAKLYEDLVSTAAWLKTKEEASAFVLSALETYRTAVRRIGMGTGPNALRHRRDAQKAMHDAQAAVPCWVMSHAKVSETLPSALGCFDLVIVDEASQSDLWALPAVLRGKKVLVVGDDKQVSPDGGFMSAQRIQELRDRFLGEQPHAAVLTPEKSLYDIASTVFAAQKVMLREHFRCVPPIIAYSNGFYDGFIQPLRIPKASERLDPPLVDIHVQGGVRGKKDDNRQEAHAIAAEIEALVADPRYAGRTLGVVSLLGPDQAKCIDQTVRARVDAKELLARKFECGDARLFQGSERDIMFLSMVVDADHCHALSGNMFEQRFNVAASRARDRMVLVRSVGLEDLSAADKLRRGLLAHFARPLHGQGADDDSAGSLIDGCESGFERQVYATLRDKGYRVVPQVKAGAFRIDMVVEGANDARLAIECDGDEFHGPDRWAADMSRQRVLERAGWTFWRCFASTWTLRRDAVVSDLLATLTAMGIEPLGAVERLPSLVEYRTWPPADPAGQASETVDVARATLEAAIAVASAAAGGPAA